MRFLLLFIFTSLGSMLIAQAPALIPYQAVARDASGQALNGATINTRFTIHDGTATGAAVWQELQTVTTSSLGLFTAQLGSSVPLTGVNWANGSKFMQVEIDLGQGFVDMGTQQMLSVPYALHAGSAPDEQQLSVSETGDTLFLENGGFVVIPGISAANSTGSGSGGTTTGTNLHTCDACAACGTYTYCYDVFEFYQQTFCPDNAGDGFVSMTFLSGTVAVNDSLIVYNGPNTWPSPQIGRFNGDLTGQTWTSTDPSGCLTFIITEWDGVGNCTDGGAEEWTYSVTTGSTVNVHNPDLTYGSMTDQEGNVYKTIVIGTQEWMAENLNTSVYRNGDAIPTNLDDATWAATTSGAWAYYNNDASYACPYGKLYNWFTCADARGLCPVGWHVPSDAEWTVLTDFLGGESVAGGKMKSTGTIEATTGLWVFPNSGATNSSGFSGLSGGDRYSDGGYFYKGEYGFWWSDSELNTNSAWRRDLNYNYGDVPRNPDFKNIGFSVRCLRD
jgi:uncharacterized protein (TIGR02145 family)